MKTKPPCESAPPMPPQWQPYYAKLKALRASLLENQIDQIAGIVEALEKNALNPADDAAGESPHHVALGILSSEQNALLEVDAAIERILDGTYGICEETGKPIPETRLRVVPWTRYTREALERIDRQRMSGRRKGAELPLWQNPDMFHKFANH